jgi:hypothetical protein
MVMVGNKLRKTPKNRVWFNLTSTGRQSLLVRVRAAADGHGK